MEMPNAAQAFVPPAKITHYLLSLEHPDGRSKAEFFERFGFAQAQWEVLAEALRRHGMTQEVVSSITTRYGVNYAVEGPLEAPDGRCPKVRTIWVVDKDDPAASPRLVTAYPQKETAE